MVVFGGLAPAVFADIEPCRAEPLVATPQEDPPRLTADGNWIIYMAFPRPEDMDTSAAAELRRVAVSGDHHSSCSPSTHRYSRLAPTRARQISER